MKVAVIGAGTMGSGIAQTFAQAESVEKVYLCDIKTEFAEGGFAKIKKGLDKQVAKGKKTQEEADAITAKNIKADEALRIGLVNAVYPQEELLAAAEKMAGQIAANAPIAVRACKKAINDGLQVNIDDALVIEEKLFGSCFESYDQREGMANFLRKKDDPAKVKVVDFQNK